MSELTLEQALILLDESRRQNIAMLDRLYESLGIDASDGEIRFKWVMIEIEEMKRERNELAATVEALRKCGNLLSTNLSYSNDPFADSYRAKWKEALAATPQQHLLDVRAEAGRAGFIAGAFWESNQVVNGIEQDCESEASNYADRVKAGE